MDTEYSFGDEVHTVCLKLTHGILFQFWMALSVIHYCAFVKNTGTLKFKSCLRNNIVVFCLPSVIITITRNAPWNMETHKMDGYPPCSHKSQTMIFWTHWRKLLFPKRSAKVIDGIEKCKCQLAFESQNLYVFEKCSNRGSNKRYFIDGHSLSQTKYILI